MNAINASAIKGDFDIDGQPMEYQERRRNQLEFNAYSIGCNVIFLENKEVNDTDNHSKEYQ